MSGGDRLDRIMERLRKRMDEGGGVAMPTEPEPGPTAAQLACEHRTWAVTGTAPDGSVSSMACADCDMRRPGPRESW